MVLLVCRENQVVQQLATGDRGVVAEIRVDKPGAVFQMRIGAHHKTHGLAAIEHQAAQTNNAVDQFHAFADLRRLFFTGADGQVLELIGALDVARRADADILDDLAVLDDAIIADGAIKTPAESNCFWVVSPNRCIRGASSR